LAATAVRTDSETLIVAVAVMCSLLVQRSSHLIAKERAKTEAEELLDPRVRRSVWQSFQEPLLPLMTALLVSHAALVLLIGAAFLPQQTAAAAVVRPKDLV